MLIREYTPADERSWLRCRAAAFLDCSYYNDVKTTKEKFLQPELSLVAVENDAVVGLIEIELDSYDLALSGDDRGAVICSLAVLPEYRRQGLAKLLWETARARLTAAGISRCEVWTQEDAPANLFYSAMGFRLEPAHTWLRCRANASGVERMLAPAAMNGIFGVDELVFNAPLSRREELSPLCDRMDEVRLYSLRFR